MYRVLRYEYKVTSKTVHVLLHCAEIICAVFGVRNIVKEKKMTENIKFVSIVGAGLIGTQVALVYFLYCFHIELEVHKGKAGQIFLMTFFSRPQQVPGSGPVHPR